MRKVVRKVSSPMSKWNVVSRTLSVLVLFSCSTGQKNSSQGPGFYYDKNQQNKVNATTPSTDQKSGASNTQKEKNKEDLNHTLLHPFENLDKNNAVNSVKPPLVSNENNNANTLSNNAENSNKQIKEGQISSHHVDITLEEPESFIPEVIGFLHELESRKRKTRTLKATGHGVDSMEHFYESCLVATCMEWMLFRWFNKENPPKDHDAYLSFQKRLENKIEDFFQSMKTEQKDRLNQRQELIEKEFLADLHLTVVFKETKNAKIIATKVELQSDQVGANQQKSFLVEVTPSFDFWKKPLVTRLQWGRKQGEQTLQQLRNLMKGTL